MLLEDVATTDDALVIAERVLGALERRSRSMATTCSCPPASGSRSAPLGWGPADMMRNADIAMYDAKRRGRSRIAVFDESMHRRVVDRLAQETELRQVVECAELDIHYQPIVDLVTGRIISLEALARWPQDRSPVPPSEFIQVAEETGIIAALGQHVLRAALRTLSGWRHEGLIDDDVCMSVNLSGKQLDDPGAGRAGPTGDRGGQPAWQRAQAGDHREHADA